VITPQVAQLIAEERIAERRRYAETAHLIHLIRAEEPSAWGRLTHRVSATTRLMGTLHRHPRPAAPAAVPCPCP